MSIVCLGRSGCLSVCLSVCLPAWLAGWLAGLSLCVCLSLCLSGCRSVWVCLGLVCLCLSGSVCLSLSLSLCQKPHAIVPPKKHQKPHAQYHSPHPVGLGTRPNTSTISIVQYPTVCLDVCDFCDVRNALSPSRHTRHRVSIVQCTLASRDVCDVKYAIWPDQHSRHHQRLVQF